MLFHRKIKYIAMLEARNIPNSAQQIKGFREKISVSFRPVENVISKKGFLHWFNHDILYVFTFSQASFVCATNETG